MRAVIQRPPAVCLAVCSALSAAFLAQPALAKDDAPAISTTYVGVTSGGSNQTGERTASAGYEQISTSAQLSSEGEQINADFSLDYRIAGAPRLDGTHLVGSFLSVSIKGSVPLNGSKPGSVVDFKTFGSGGNLTLGFNYFRPRVTSVSQSYPVIRQLARYCVATSVSKWGDDEHGSPAEAAAGAAALGRFDQSAADTELGVFEIIKETVGDEAGTGTVGKAIAENCSKDNPKLTDDSSFIDVFATHGLTPAEAAAWRRNVRSEGTLFLGGQVSLGYNRFDIVDRTALANRPVDRIGYDANGRIGYVFGGANVMALGTFGYTRSYKAKDVVDVCGPPDINGKSICINGQDGAPDRKDTGYAGAVLRVVVLRNKDGEATLGIRPSATYVFEDKDWQLEIPVFFQHTDTGGLDAGVKGIYNTGKKDFGIGAFVGLAF